MRKPSSMRGLEDLGRVRLSKNFFFREFLFSEIAAVHGIANVPDDPELAIESGRRLCEDLLEPLQATFGRLHLRSGYRSAAVNEFGNRNNLNCSTNAASAADHIWDMRDVDGCMGATACVVIPWLIDNHDREGDWQKMAWWMRATGKRWPGGSTTTCLTPRFASSRSCGPSTSSGTRGPRDGS
jgi:hypothetical protein